MKTVSKKVFIILFIFCAGLVFASSGCGKKGPPQPPDEARYFGAR